MPLSEGGVEITGHGSQNVFARMTSCIITGYDCCHAPEISHDVYLYYNRDSVASLFSLLKCHILYNSSLRQLWWIVNKDVSKPIASFFNCYYGYW